MSVVYLGDFNVDATVYVPFTTHNTSGGAAAPSAAFNESDVSIYKNGSATQKTSTNGLTMTSPFDSITGLHMLTIDTSNDTGDTGFWTQGADYVVTLAPNETLSGQSVVAVLAHFSIENRSALRPSTPGTEIFLASNGNVAATLTSAAVDLIWQEDLSGHTTAGTAGLVLSNAYSAAAAPATLTSGAVDAIWDESIAGHTSVGTTGRQILLAASILSEVTIIGTPTTTTIQLQTGSAVDDFYNDLQVVPTSGDQAGQARIITDYTGSTATITVDEAWTTALAAGVTVSIRAIHMHTRNQIRDSILADSTPFNGATIGNTYSLVGDSVTNSLNAYSAAGAAQTASLNAYSAAGLASTNAANAYSAAGVAVTNSSANATSIANTYSLTGVAVANSSANGTSISNNYSAIAVAVTNSANAYSAAAIAATNSSANGTSLTNNYSAIGVSVTNSANAYSAAALAVTNLAITDAVVDNIYSSIGAGVTLTAAAITSILTTQMTESYASAGTAPTLAQALYMIHQQLGDFAISGTTITVKKLDGSTTAATFTLDDGTTPTSAARAT